MVSGAELSRDPEGEILSSADSLVPHGEMYFVSGALLRRRPSARTFLANAGSPRMKMRSFAPASLVEPFIHRPLFFVSRIPHLRISTLAINNACRVLSCT
eukprot:1957709-Pyramimonas_sp.AAC.1